MKKREFLGAAGLGLVAPAVALGVEQNASAEEVAGLFDAGPYLQHVNGSGNGGMDNFRQVPKLGGVGRNRCAGS